MTAITLSNINKRFGEKVLFRDYSLHIEAGEFVAIKGESGAGKTTLLNIIGLLETPDSGSVTLCGARNPSFSSRAAVHLRRHKLSYLFQNYGLVDTDTVEANMKLATRFGEAKGKAEKERIADALAQVGLSGYERRKVYTLSGGEQQRVALAKIIAKSPDIMINRYERLNQELKMVETKRKVAAYCRVSTDNEDQANSFESQQRYFRQYIERNPDWELYEIFADEGISGTNTKKRKEFNRMIACAKNGDFDLIITKEISRFARNTLDSIYYTRELKKHGVGVIFMNDNINTLDGDAELRLAIMSSIAQEESRKTSERVKWGQKRQMEQGVVFGRSMLGYDVDGGKMTINEEGAKVVRLIFHKFVNEGKGTHVIARELREEGISPMRVKEWSNTVILRVIRNEKYCGDLVQKKTYTPDFLSHEKKYNRGQEEFVIIKDHHEPIISRELFDEANRILDAKSLSQEGKAKHSNRYPFSGKIKCGCCGSSYVARYKTRKDGSRYKAWRCNEAAKHGSPHIDKAGNQVGCTGLSIRNEDATHIMYLVTKSLKYNRNKIINNLTAVIQSIIAMDTTGTDVLKLQEQIKKIEGKRANLIDLYMSNLINKDEFTATRASCDAEIEELQSIIESVDKQREMIEQQQQLLKEIEDAIKEIVSGVEYEDEFYKHILDKMVVQDKDNIDVYLNLLPMKWSYTVAKASKKAVASEWNISEASLPMSVSRAFSSG